MSTQFPIYKDRVLKIELDERSCKFELNVSINDNQNMEDVDTSSERLDEDQVIDIAVNLLGPMHYYCDKPEEILKKVAERLEKRGYV